MRYDYAQELWFDALWNCLSVGRRNTRTANRLWFDALWNCLSVVVRRVWSRHRCDLMLFEIVFQLVSLLKVVRLVVIWCSLKLSFSVVVTLPTTLKLWFDALWNCLSVCGGNQWIPLGCDLMLFEIVFQWNDRTNHRLRVVIWCSLKLSFSIRRRRLDRINVVIWCSLKLSFSHRLRPNHTCGVVIWCSLKLSFSTYDWRQA